MDVLVVEDETLIREVVREDLTDEGLSVSEAPSAEAALSVAMRCGPPEVVVTDLELGAGMNGLALASEMRRRWPNTGIIVITGSPGRVPLSELGPRERLLPKPFLPERLVHVVRELMAQRP